MLYLRGGVMPSKLSRMATLLLAMLAIAGCTKPVLKGKSPLAPARMSPDSCVLDVFSVRVPIGDAQANEELWKELDEQHLPADLRVRLMRNGFRAGVVDGQIPEVLSNLLELDGKPPPGDEVKGTALADLGTTPNVVRRHIQARTGQPNQIIASGMYEQLPVLFCESDRISGETYNQAQGIFDLKAFPLPDGRVRIDLVPEVHHDQARQRRVAEQGVMLLDFSKPKRVFEELSITATLSPGGMLVLTSLPNRPGSLGHQFFTEKDGKMEQKVLVLRIAQTQHDDLIETSE
jgi:hypothetical protein